MLWTCSSVELMSQKMRHHLFKIFLNPNNISEMCTQVDRRDDKVLKNVCEKWNEEIR